MSDDAWYGLYFVDGVGNGLVRYCQARSGVVRQVMKGKCMVRRGKIWQGTVFKLMG